MTPTERRTLHPAAVVEAWDWIDIYCRHLATAGRDWQTTENLTAEQRPIAEIHLRTLRDAGMLREGGFRGNFEVLPCRQS